MPERVNRARIIAGLNGSGYFIYKRPAFFISTVILKLSKIDYI